MKANRPKPKSDWRDGFLFLGGNLALDFLNTRPLVNDEPRELLDNFSSLLRWFRAAKLITSGEQTRLERSWADSGRAKRTVAAMRSLRERLRKEILAWEHGGRVSPAMTKELNKMLAMHPMLRRLQASRLSLHLWFKPSRPEDLWAPLAHSAARLFVEADRNRVRKCEQCVLHFLDTSKKGSRHWCSMRLCGNRVKVAAYAARRRRNRVMG